MLEVEDVFSSYGRVKVMSVIMESNELNISEITRRAGISHSSVELHLDFLVKGGPGHREEVQQDKDIQGQPLEPPGVPPAAVPRRLAVARLRPGQPRWPSTERWSRSSAFDVELEDVVPGRVLRAEAHRGDLPPVADVQVGAPFAGLLAADEAAEGELDVLPEGRPDGPDRRSRSVSASILKPSALSYLTPCLMRSENSSRPEPGEREPAPNRIFICPPPSAGTCRRSRPGRGSARGVP